ncbi:MAG: FliA/WhiG family RNA polymerase sigma factor [Ammonifex sp.]|jgi:RNA polymerase sigma factor for flagellar operon FliA|nr:MAG: FliA/WhiG family RNA polymerase sigma factor [Ammonifex sp.]
MAVEEVWHEYKVNGKETARQELILKHLPMVKQLAGRLAVRLPPWISQEDLESAGIFGLMAAIERFDPDHGTDFEAYAYRRVRGAMLDEVRRLTWLPRSLWQRMQEVNAAREEMEKKSGQRPSDDELAKVLGITPAELVKVTGYFQALCPASLEEVVNVSNGSQLSWGDLIEDPLSPDPLEVLNNNDDHKILERAISRLDEKLKLVLALYYQEGLTLKEIGRVLNVSESRVCQLHAKAIKKLREIMYAISEVGSGR